MSKSIKENLLEFKSATQEYVESSIEYHKLDIYRKLMKGAVSTTYLMIIGFFLIIALLFLSIALGIYLGQVVGSAVLGYLIVGAAYIVIAVLLSLFLKKSLEKILLIKTSKQFFKDVAREVKNTQYESLQ